MNIEVIPNEQTPRVEFDINPYTTSAEDWKIYIDKLEAFRLYAESRNDAAGLAANQVSIDGERFMTRVFALRMPDKTMKLIINPVVKGFGMVDNKLEGCLTWKGRLVWALRNRGVEVSYYDMDGKIHLEKHHGFQAQVWQHEVNHLNGIEETIVYHDHAFMKDPEPQRNDKCPCGNVETNIDVFVLHEIYDSGKTLQDLEDLTGIGRKVISRWFKKHGLHVRTKSECATGELNSQFDGQPRYTEDGYVEIWNGTERMLEHRYVMEQQLNRKLTTEEVVHHINGIKDDNTPTNLEVLSHIEHMKRHKLPIGQWSRNYEFCLKCGTTDRKHAGNGYCTKCNMVIRDNKKRGYESEYDENGKRLFTDEHRENLRQAAIIREVNKKYKQCCLLLK